MNPGAVQAPRRRRRRLHQPRPTSRWSNRAPSATATSPTSSSPHRLGSPPRARERADHGRRRQAAPRNRRRHQPQGEEARRTHRRLTTGTHRGRPTYRRAGSAGTARTRIHSLTASQPTAGRRVTFPPAGTSWKPRPRPQGVQHLLRGVLETKTATRCTGLRTPGPPARPTTSPAPAPAPAARRPASHSAPRPTAAAPRPGPPLPPARSPAAG